MFPIKVFQDTLHEVSRYDLVSVGHAFFGAESHGCPACLVACRAAAVPMQDVCCTAMQGLELGTQPFLRANSVQAALEFGQFFSTVPRAAAKPQEPKLPVSQQKPT